MKIGNGWIYFDSEDMADGESDKTILSRLKDVSLVRELDNGRIKVYVSDISFIITEETLRALVAALIEGRCQEESKDLNVRKVI